MEKLADISWFLNMVNNSLPEPCFNLARTGKVVKQKPLSFWGAVGQSARQEQARRQRAPRDWSTVPVADEESNKIITQLMQASKRLRDQNLLTAVGALRDSLASVEFWNSYQKVFEALNNMGVVVMQLGQRYKQVNTTSQQALMVADGIAKGLIALNQLCKQKSTEMENQRKTKIISRKVRGASRGTPPVLAR